LNGQQGAAKIFRKERSSSAVVFYWGMSSLFSELDLHNIFFSVDYKAEFYHLFKTKKIYPDPTVYINITSKQEPGIHAPDGKENWFVMINAPSGFKKIDAGLVSQVRAAVIKKISRILKKNIETFIETENVMTPADIEINTNAFEGALYGTSSNAALASFSRHPNFNNKIKGLYFAGGTVHPGGGIPLCLKSAKIVAGLIKNDFQHAKH
jgi:phytoene dehydrogenase-like protein